jgi:hypothetical protein
MQPTSVSKKGQRLNPLGRSLKSSRAWASVSTHLKISEDQCAVSTAGIITQAIKK